MSLFRRLILALIPFLLAISRVSCASDDPIKVLSPRASPDDGTVAAVVELIRESTLNTKEAFCPPCVDAGLELYVRANRDPGFSGITISGLTDEQARSRQNIKERLYKNLVST